MTKIYKKAVAMGLFDGVHDGHRLVLDEALSYKFMTPAVFTFNTESVKIKHGRPFEYIYPNAYKLNLLNILGFEYIFSPDFDELRNMDGEAFAENILCGKMNAGAVICGENFRFGRNAACGAQELTRFGKKYGFEVKIIQLGNDAFSSEKFRALLRDGNTEELYRRKCPYSICSEVVEGNRIGRTINFPTINQSFADRQLIPRKGVYATTTVIDGCLRHSITNIGVKPTVGDNIKPLAETHILDYDGNLYGRTIKVEFHKFIRSEKKFSSVDELKKQISNDIACVTELKNNT